ncbi:MAG TPA: Uma2 family endonuclease [Acidobacteriaceae bacterium]|nr:Uma2 family endonuclease [Acidobacteriaceae bacterium]
MMIEPSLLGVPVEVYLHSSYEPDAEYVDGTIEHRPAPEYDHASWQQAVMEWFWQRTREWNVRVLPSLRVQVARNRFRVPDVTVLDRNQPIEQIITHSPMAVFEILSPEDSMMRMTQKLGEYAAMGIPHIWVIDPANRQAWRFHDNQLNLASSFGDPGDKIHFDLAEIEKLLD